MEIIWAVESSKEVFLNNVTWENAVSKKFWTNEKIDTLPIVTVHKFWSLTIVHIFGLGYSNSFLQDYASNLVREITNEIKMTKMTKSRDILESVAEL